MTAPSLWREPSFVLLWTGQTASLAGAQVRLVVLPVLMFQLTGSAALTALLVTVEAAPYLLFGLLTGAVADRVDRRRLMIVCDLASAATMASIPPVAAAGVLTPAHVLVAGAVTGTAFVWHDSALFGALPLITGRERITAAYGVLVSTSQVLQLGATAAAGFLVAVTGATNALWIDAAGYAIGALTIALIPAALGPDPRARPTRSSLRADIGEGLRYIRHHPVVGPLTAAGFGAALTGGAVTGLVVVHAVTRLGLAADDARLGWLYTALAAGGLAAAVLLGPLTRLVGTHRVSLYGLPALAVGAAAIGVADTFASGIAAYAAWGLCSTLVITNAIALRQELTPDALQGRVNASARMIAYGGAPFGAALAGAVAERLDTRATLLLVAPCALLAALTVWSSPVRTADTDVLARLRAEADRAR